MAGCTANLCKSLGDSVLKWIIARLREPSSWRGIVWLLTVFGLALKPDQAEAIVTAGMALAGLLGVFLSDDRPHSVERDAVGCGGDSAASGADRVRDDLPELELVGKPLAETGREGAGSSGGARQRTAPARSADELRQPVLAKDSPRPDQPADPNTYPRFGSGWGDRD